jgi:hypothetical protein
MQFANAVIIHREEIRVCNYNMPKSSYGDKRALIVTD